jgi:hypothetical protein
VTVNVDPGTTEGDIVEITRLVSVDGGLLTGLEGDRFGETELVSGGRENEGIAVGEKDGFRLTLKELMADEGSCVEGGEGVKESEDLKDVKEGSETVVIV